MSIKKTPKQNHDALIKEYDRRLTAGMIKPQTHGVYLNQLRLIERLTGNEGEYDLSKIESYPWETIPDGIKRSTFDNLLTTIYMNYKILDKRVPDRFKELSRLKHDQVAQAESHAPLKTLPFDNYEEVVKLLPKTQEEMTTFFDLCPCLYQRQKNMMYLGMAFFTLMPPMRPSEIINLAITSKPLESGNYLNLHEGKMYFKDYKTYHTYGDLVLDVPDQLLKTLKHFWVTLFPYRGDSSIRYIFTKEDGEPMRSNNFTKFFQKIPYLKGITPTDLRNLCVSSLGDEDAVSKAMIARFMKHSNSTQSQVYSKYNKVLYPDNPK